MNRQALCDPHRIEHFLDQKLSDEEQTAFELHLDDCHACRRQLETATANEDAWRHVRDSLGASPVLLSPSGREAGDEGGSDNDSALDSVAEEVSSGPATILKLLAPTDDDRMIGRWGTYEVVGVVGTGGMGVVLKAFDAALNRYVAIKVLAPHLGTSGAAIRRFSREGKAAAAVVHDNVVEIYHVAEAAGLPYLVMPYVRGPSLQRRLNDEGPLATVEILRVGMQAAAGLAAAHAQGLVHRDVKPANILLADGIERVKLTDFGLARAADDASLTRTGVIAGTPQYMSPEQARGEPVDRRSDLFSLGSVLYAMCTGRPPFRAETSYGVLRRITDEEPRPIREINPDIPDWLCAIVAKLMAKQPDDRFQSAGEVAKLLEECLAHVQQPTIVPLPDVLLIPARRDREESITTERDEYGSANPNRTRKRGHFPSLAAAVGLLFFGGLMLACGILIHIKKDNKTTTVEVPEGSTAHVDAQGDVTLELPPSGATAAMQPELAKNKGRAPYSDHTPISPLDVLQIDVTDALPDEPIEGYYGVEPDGNVALGPTYGRVNVSGLNVEQAEARIVEKLTAFLRSPMVHVTIARANPPWHDVKVPRQPFTIEPYDALGIVVRGTLPGKPILNCFTVSSDGSVALGPEYGRVPLKGLTLEEAEKAIATKLREVLKDPKVYVALPLNLRPAASPKAPYAIKPSDLLCIVAVGVQSEEGIGGLYAVGPRGTVALGPMYGRVNVQGLTLEAAEKAIQTRLKEFAKAPAVSVTVAGWSDWGTPFVPSPVARLNKRPASLPSDKSEMSFPTYRIEPPDVLQIELIKPSSGTKSVTGKYLVGPDGTVNLRQYGFVNVTGKTVAETRTTLQKHLAQYFESPDIFLDVAAVNSKFYHVITQGPKLGDTVHKFPITGNDTVLDAVSHFDGLSNVSSKKMWIERPAQNRFGEKTTLPIDWDGIAQGAREETNYLLFPGDRLYISDEHARAIQFDGNHYAKVDPPPKFTSGDFTISLWFNPLPPSISAFPFMRGFAHRDRRGDIGLDFAVRGGLDFKAASGDRQWIFAWSPESRLHGRVRYGQWNHAVVTRSGRTYSMWMNGERVGSENSSADISDDNNTNPFIVGGHMDENGVVGEMYRGDLDDFRILHRCLSDKEIATLYKSGGDETAMKGEGRVPLGPLCAATVDVQASREVGGAKYTFPPGPGLSPVPSPRTSGPPAVSAIPPGITVRITGVGGPEGWWLADGIRLSSYNHSKDHYLWILSESGPGSTIVLLFALDHADKDVPAEYKDMLPTPWTKIEAALRKGETVESVGSFWQRRVVLLAAPTVAQLEELIRKTKLLAEIDRKQATQWASENVKKDIEKTTTFQPLDCVLVDEKTGQPLPGNDFAISLRFVIPRTKDRPWQLVDEVFLGPNHPGTFQFTVPDKVLRHPDRDVILVEWTIVHPHLDARDEHDPIRVNEILNDDPRTARETIRRIKMHSANIRKGQRPEHFDEFMARVQMLQYQDVQKVGRDPLVKGYEQLLKDQPAHPYRATAMLALATLWQVTNPGLGIKPDPKEEIRWLREACKSAAEGSDEWFEARFRLVGAIYEKYPDEANRILDDLIQHAPDSVVKVKSLVYKQMIAIVQKQFQEAEAIFLRLQKWDIESKDMPKELFKKGQVFEQIQDSARLMMFAMVGMRIPKAERKAKIEELLQKCHLRQSADRSAEAALQYMEGLLDVNPPRSAPAK